MPRLLTADDVAEILGVSRAQVYAVKHRIGFVKLGRVVRFQQAALDSYIQAHTQSTPDAIGKIRVADL